MARLERVFMNVLAAVLIFGITVSAEYARAGAGAAKKTEATELLKHKGRVIQVTGALDSLGSFEWAKTNGSTRMPDLIALSDTHWLIVYCENPKATTVGDWSRLVLKETHDAGKSWTARILDEQRKSSKNYLGNWNNQEFTRLSDGRIVLSTVLRGGRSYIWFSEDQGKTWGIPIEPRMVDGKRAWIFCAFELADGSLGSYSAGGHFSVSGDGGWTWEARGKIEFPEYKLCEAGHFVKDDHVQIYCRDNRRDANGPLLEACMVVLRSEDGMRTWKKIRAIKEAPGGHQSKVYQLRDGRLLALYRVTNEVGVDVWLHDFDTLEGKTFPVDRDPSSKRPWDFDCGGIAELSDGTILLCYGTKWRGENQYWPEKRIRVLVLPPGTFPEKTK